MDSEVQECKTCKGSRCDRAVSRLFGKSVLRVSCLMKLNQSRVIFRLFSERTKNEWWQMAERRGPPTRWKNRLPASLWCVPWVVEHLRLLGQGRSWKSLT